MPGSGRSTTEHWTHSRLTLRRRPARHRRRIRGGAEVAAALRWPTRSSPTPPPAPAPAPAGGNAQPDDAAGRRGAAAAGAARCAVPGRRSAQPGHPRAGPQPSSLTTGYVYRFRQDDATAPRGRRRLHPVRIPDGAGRPPTRRRGRRRPLFRTQPRRVRAARVVLRGVRRRATATARQPAAGVRACPDAGILPSARRASARGA